MEQPLEKSDFRAIAVTLRSSRDVGSQLFCALLRSVGVESRLVCSLQPLPFTVASKPATPQKLKPPAVVSDFGSRPTTSDEDSGVDVHNAINAFGSTSSKGADSTSPLVPKRAKRLGQPTFASDTDPSVSKPPSPKGWSSLSGYLYHLTNVT